MLSERQREVMSFAKSTATSMLAVGAIRSGKTHVASRSFAMASLVAGGRHLVLGRNLRVLENEVLPHFPFSDSYNGSRHTLKVADSEFMFIGASDVRATGRLRGLTIKNLFADEVSEIPEPVLEMATSRCSFANSKMWLCSNPDSPLHWLKRGWIDGDKFDHVVQFGLDDNPSLADEVKRRYKEMYSGTFYRRFILGEWAAATGLVYPEFTLAPDMTEPHKMSAIGLDYGNTTAFIPVYSYADGTYQARGVEYLTSDEDGEWRRTDAQIADALADVVERTGIRNIVADPSAASLQAEWQARHAGKAQWLKADNTVLEGIRVTQNALSRGKLTLGSGTGPLQDELQSYVWRRTATGITLDEPVKEFDHAVDALRYAMMWLSKGYEWTVL